MVALVSQLKQQQDHGILDEIQNMHCYSIFIEHCGRWIAGGRLASHKEARKAAIQAFNCSRLPIEVRQNDGTVVFGLRVGYPDVVADQTQS